MYCLRFRIPGKILVAQDPDGSFANALMTATGGQIPGHESISEAAIRILRNALMSTKHVYEQMDQNHCAHESIDEDHFESRVASRTLVGAAEPADCRHSPWLPVDTLC